MNTKADILMKLFCSNNKSTKTKEYIFNNNSFCLVAYTQTHTHTHTHTNLATKRRYTTHTAPFIVNIYANLRRQKSFSIIWDYPKLPHT